MTSGLYTANQGRQPASQEFLPDRLSMAIAVEDDSISDDVLVDRLEKVRTGKIGGPSERGKNISSSRSSGNAHFRSVGEDTNGFFYTSRPSSSPPTPEQCDVLLPSPLMSKDTTSDSDDAAVWQAARKALLCIREIIRTEKKYQEALRMLLNAQVWLPPSTSSSPHDTT